MLASFMLGIYFRNYARNGNATRMDATIQKKYNNIWHSMNKDAYKTWATTADPNRAART